MLFAIALGGALGSLLRYGLGSAVQQRIGAGFPAGTLLVNVTGSLLLGFLVRYLVETAASPEMRAALTIGFCGGYTTFSTFSLDTLRLLEEGSWGRAGTYVLASVALSLLAMVAGLALARAALAHR
jgi:CrcB protein